jgi:sulfate adenylyltransferase
MPSRRLVRSSEHTRERTLLVPPARADAVRRALNDCVSWTVAGGQLTDLEALLSGLLAPCAGYGPHAAAPGGARGVPCPTLEISSSLAERLVAERTLALRDPEGVLLAGLRVSEVSRPRGAWVASGRVEGIELPTHHDFRHLRLTPADIEERTSAHGWRRVLAFFPSRVMHAGTRAALVHIAAELDAGILLLVPASEADRDELAFFHRVRGLESSSAELPGDRTILALVPINLPADPAQRVLLQRTVALNCGATHCAVDQTTLPKPWGPASAGPTHEGSWDPASAGFSPGAEFSSEPVDVPFQPWGFNATRQGLEPPSGVTDGSFDVAPAEDDILARIGSAGELPTWLFSAAELERLQQAGRPRARDGFTVFFTGLSGSGKSTIAGALRARLMEATGRPITLLDGDLVRRHLSSELGFSREHRDLNILRIGWVAAEITRHGGIAVCAPIAPYDAIRRQVRTMVEATGGFVLVHVATPLEVCERRDRKGLYARARAGLLPQFTGISDPYEAPDDAALRIDTDTMSVDDACDAVMAWLRRAGYLAGSAIT